MVQMRQKGKYVRGGNTMEKLQKWKMSGQVDKTDIMERRGDCKRSLYVHQGKWTFFQLWMIYIVTEMIVGLDLSTPPPPPPPPKKKREPQWFSPLWRSGAPPAPWTSSLTPAGLSGTARLRVPDPRNPVACHSRPYSPCDWSGPVIHRDAGYSTKNPSRRQLVSKKGKKRSRKSFQICIILFRVRVRVP